MGKPRPWKRKWQRTPVLLPGKSHGQRSLEGCSPWGRKESGTTERLDFHFSLPCIGEGNGNPLQCSCLENPRDRGASWAAVYGVAQSQTRLKRLSSSSSRQKYEHTKETRIERDTCTLTFIAALFTIAGTWMQPRCPSADEWIRKLWYIYTTEYYSAIKKNTFESVLMRWMKLEPIIQSEVSQKKPPIQFINAHIWNL